MTAGGAEAVALKLLAVIAKAEGIDLDQVKGGWSRKEILASYRECLTAVRSVFPAPVFTQAPEEPVARVFGADEAWQNVVRRNKFARWALGENPKRVENSAAMRLRAPVFLPGMSPKFRIQNSDVIFCIGSCFARNIEGALIDFGFDCASIPAPELQRDGLQSETLTKFSTVAMLSELRWALDPDAPFDDTLLLCHDDGSFTDPHSRHGVSRVSREEALAARHRVIEAMRAIRRSDVVILTLGLVEAWYDNELGIYLNEAPAFPVAQKSFGRFSLHVLDYRQNLAALQSIYALLTAKLPRCPRILLTVSPVPFTSTFSDKDVVVANTYSKATLRAVAQDFAEPYEAVDYVPVYEAVINSSAEAAWKRDRIHVTDAAVRANVLHFLANYLGDPDKSSQAAAALKRLLGGNRLDRQHQRQVPLPDFEVASADATAFPAGVPEASASSELALNYGARFLGSGPTVPWHAKTPLSYPQTVSIAFAAPLKAKALWLQAQDHHLDRAPCKFSVYGCRSDNERHLLLRSRSKPRWDFMGWASWHLREARAFARFEIVIEENCGNPELLTLQRLWFEPAPCSVSIEDEIPAAASVARLSGPDPATGPQHERNTEYADTGA
jgi:GSCFA family protein